jgi:hypothetical protein
MRRRPWFVLGALILALAWASPTVAQEEPILRFEGRVTYVAPSEMLVALDSGGVVMLDLARIPQGEIRQITQNDYDRQGYGQARSRNRGCPPAVLL